MAVINRVRVGIPSTQRATCCSVPTYTRKKPLQTTLSFSIRPYFNFSPSSRLVSFSLIISPSKIFFFTFFAAQFQLVLGTCFIPAIVSLREIEANRGSCADTITIQAIGTASRCSVPVRKFIDPELTIKYSLPISWKIIPN